MMNMVDYPMPFLLLSTWKQDGSFVVKSYLWGWWDGRRRFLTPIDFSVPLGLIGFLNIEHEHDQ